MPPVRATLDGILKIATARIRSRAILGHSAYAQFLKDLVLGYNLADHASGDSLGDRKQEYNLEKYERNQAFPSG